MQKNATPEAKGRHLEGFSFVEECDGIREYRLDANGLQVLLLPQSAAPIVTLMVTYRVGSRNEGLGLTGATHFLEHLMFKGSERFNKRAGTSVFNLLQSVGAQVNATTWFDRTNYYEMMPMQHLGLAVEIEADRMRGALLSEEDLESERTVILNELDRGESEPFRKLYQAVWAAAFTAHPYHHPTIGWRSDVEAVTAAGLRGFYDTFYWPNNATVSIIGALDPPDALALLNRHFGGIEASLHSPPKQTTREPEQRGERRVTVRQAGQIASLMIAFKSPPALDVDTDALDVLSVVLGAGKNSRLYRRLTDSGLTAAAGASASRLSDPGLFYIYASITPGRTHEEVEHAIYEEVERIKLEGVEEAELQRARAQMRAQEAFARDGSFNIAARLNEAIAAGDWRLHPNYMARIDAVSAEDVQRVATAILVESRRTVGLYVPE